MQTILQYVWGARVGALLFGTGLAVLLAVEAPGARAQSGEAAPATEAVSPAKSIPPAETRPSNKPDTKSDSKPEGDAEPTDFLSRYRVGPGDVISIRLFGEDDLNREKVRLTDTGTIPYPVLGEVRVLGMRPVEIEKFIEDGLRGRYLKNPRVSVTVDEYRPYFVTGEIGKAGSYPYIPGMTVLKAITIAGGFKERASRSKIFIAKESNPKDRRKVEMSTPLEPGDILTIEESFF